MSKLHNIVELQVLTAARGSTVDRYDARLVKNIRVQSAGAPFAKSGDKLPYPVFGHQETGGENIRPHLEKAGSLRFLTDVSHLSAIEHQMRILVTPGETLADRRMLSIHNHEQAHIRVAYH